MLAAVLVVATQEKGPTLEELRKAVAIYLEYGLPVPPRDAQLVGVSSGVFADGRVRYRVAFRYTDPMTGELKELQGIES